MVENFSLNSPGAFTSVPEKALPKILGILNHIGPKPRRNPAQANPSADAGGARNDLKSGLRKQTTPAIISAISRTAKSILLKKPKPAKNAAKKAKTARRRSHQTAVR